MKDEGSRSWQTVNAERVSFILRPSSLILSLQEDFALSTIDVVKKFWSLMQSNNFSSVGEVLSDDYVLEWPQSKERIRGRANYVVMNQEYPAHGRWKFTVNRIIGDESEAVSDVFVSDGVQHARVISFFSIADGKIQKMVEFWPDPFAPEENRRHLVEPMDS